MYSFFACQPLIELNKVVKKRNKFKIKKFMAFGFDHLFIRGKERFISAQKDLLSGPSSGLPPSAA